MSNLSNDKKVLKVIEDMMAEFRALDLPYGSKAYNAAKELAIELRLRCNHK